MDLTPKAKRTTLKDKESAKRFDVLHRENQKVGNEAALCYAEVANLEKIQGSFIRRGWLLQNSDFSKKY